MKMSRWIVATGVLVMVGGCDERAAKQPAAPLPVLATAAGQPGGFEVAPIGVRVDVPPGAKARPGADGTTEVVTSRFTLQLSVGDRSFTLREADSVADQVLPDVTVKLRRCVQGRDGWYCLICSSYLDEPPTCLASVYLEVGEREINCKVFDRDQGRVLDGIAACFSMR